MHINYYACIPAAVFAVLLPRVPLLSPVQVMMMVVNNHWLCDGDDDADDDADEDDDDGDVVDTEHLAALATSGPCLSNYSSTFIQRYCEHHQPFFFSTFGFFFVSCLFFAMLRNLLSKQFIWTFNNENSSSSMLAAMVEDGGNNDNIVEN